MAKMSRVARYDQKRPSTKRTHIYKNNEKHSYSITLRVIVWSILTLILEGLISIGLIYLSVKNPSWIVDSRINMLGQYILPMIPVFVFICQLI